MKTLLFPAISFAVAFIFALSGKAFAAVDEEPKSFTYTIGSATLITLPDTLREMPVNIFTGAPQEKINELAKNGIPASVSAFLVKNGKDVIVIDTGNGKRENPKSWLLQKLAQADVKPEEVTHILLTHLHGDHVGGLSWDGKAAFPNAKVFVSNVEKEYWLSPETLAINPNRQANIELIRKNFALYPGNVQTFTFGDTVAPGITALEAIGHTPGHTAFLLESNGKSLLLWGDLVHGASLQFADPNICASFDMDPAQAVRTRVKFMEMAAQKNIPVAGAHLPVPAVGMIKPGKDGAAYAFTLGAE